MYIRIFYGLIIVAMVSSGTAFAQNSLISVQTDNSHYDYGDTILISGKITTIIGNTQVTLQLFQAGNLIDVAQIKVGQDGNFSHTIIAQGPLWKNDGDFTLKAVYGEANISETSFNFTSEFDIIETTTNYEVTIGDSGTFDIKYSIRGGTVKDIRIDPYIFGLVLSLDANTSGSLVLDLPRKFIDAEKQNGKDEVFIILIDDVQTVYQEKTTFSETRTIMIDFEEGDSEIQIIGTYVIPEFGTIVMIILTIGIMASILLTRNKFQIKI